MSSSSRIRRRVLYRGSVQGVGFRLTTLRIARRHPVTGYVKNLPGGAVQLTIDGPAAAVNSVLAEIAAAMSDNIRETDVEDLTDAEQFDVFEIRH